METNENMKGYVYMVIPEALKGTNRVKIGMSKCNNYNRIKSYGKNVEIKIKYDCYNPKELEKIIINIFKHKFNIIQGNEYFEGDIEEMTKEFYRVINSPLNNNSYVNSSLIEYYKKNNLGLYNNYKVSSKNEIKNLLGDSDTDTDKMQNIKNNFPNYKQDITFNGTKKLLKLTYDGDSINVKHLLHNIVSINNTDHIVINELPWIDEFDIVAVDETESNCLSKNWEYLISKKQLFQRVYPDEIICDYNIIYKLLQNNKAKIKNIIFAHGEELGSNMVDKDIIEPNMRYLFTRDTILNKNTYAIGYKDEMCKKNKYKIIDFDVGGFDYKLFRIIKLFGKYYSSECIKKNIPYYIDYNNETYTYKIYNRYYEEINTYKKGGFGKRQYIYKDGGGPLCGYDKLKECITNYKNIIHKNNLTTCLNENNIFNEILNNFK